MFMMLLSTAIITIDSNLYSFSNPYRENIRRDVLHSVKMAEPKIRKQWRHKQVETLTTALVAVEDVYPHINHKYLLSTILTESEMDIYCVPKHRNENGSIDYGLSQQNSRYIKERYAKARKILKSMHIKHTKNKFDILVNVMAGAVTLDEFKHDLTHKKYRNRIPKKYKHIAHFIAYNTGVGGFFNPNREHKRSQYYNRYKKYFVRL
jgi:hypothetical protein